MKRKLGIIGGMGSQAGAWLLQRIITLSPAGSDQEHLEILLHNNSVIPDRTRAIVDGETSPVAEIQRSVRLLNDGGVDVIILACMTSYYFYEDILKCSMAKIIHPVPIILNELARNGSLTKVGLIGSPGLLRSRLFQDILEPNGIEVLTLSDEAQQKYFIQPVYHMMKAGKPSEEMKELFLVHISLLKSQGAEVIIGACSEIPLIIERNSLSIPFIDVFELLANKTVDYCYDGIQI